MNKAFRRISRAWLSSNNANPYSRISRLSLLKSKAGPSFSTSIVLDEESPFNFHRSRYLPADRFIIMREPEISENSGTQRVTLSLPQRNVSIELNPSHTVEDLKRELRKRPRKTKISKVEFRSYDNNLMTDSSPVSLLLTLPYYLIKVNDHTFYTVLNERNFALNNEKHRIEVEQLPLYTYAITKLGMSSGNAKTLSEFSNSVLESFPEEDKEVSQDKLNLIIRQALVKRARELRLESNYLKEHLIKLEDEQQILSDDYKALSSKAQQHAVRRARQFISIFVLQFFLTQYGTYIMFSWDIMEPITCAMTLGDAVLGYLFWMWSKRGYEASSIHDYIYQRRLDKIMRKNRFDKDRFQMVKDSIRIIKKRLYEIS